MKIALYCRVSTDEQADHGFSIDHQKERLIAYANSQGWDDYRLYIDDGYTGTSLARPAIRRLIQHAKDGKIQAVVVYKLDRLSRKQKDILHLLEDVFDKHGVVFKSATEPFDTGTSLGKAMIGILAVFAQLERDTIIERTTAGRRQRFNQGMWYGGRVPFGYDWDGKQLKVNPIQADLVREIFKKYLEGQSYNQIGEWANERTTERFIDHGRVREMLTRFVYTGRLQNNGVIVEGNHEAIISPEVWEAAQAEMAKRRGGVKPSGKYLLTGLLECGVCHGRMVHVLAKSRGKSKTNIYAYEYYLCKKQHVKPKGFTETCNLGFKRANILEEQVIAKLRNLALNPSELALERPDEDSVGQLILELNAALKEVESKLNRWYEAFEEGALDVRQFKSRTGTLEQEREAIQIRLDELDAPLPPDRSEAITESLRLIADAWDILTLDEQKIVLKSAVRKIIVYPGEKLPDFEWNV